MQKILLSTWRNYCGRSLQDKEVVDTLVMKNNFRALV